MCKRNQKEIYFLVNFLFRTKKVTHTQNKIVKKILFILIKVLRKKKIYIYIIGNLTNKK